jgi:hypothetical protein
MAAARVNHLLSGGQTKIASRNPAKPQSHCRRNVAASHRESITPCASCPIISCEGLRANDHREHFREFSPVCSAFVTKSEFLKLLRRVGVRGVAHILTFQDSVLSCARSITSFGSAPQFAITRAFPFFVNKTRSSPDQLHGLVDFATRAVAPRHLLDFQSGGTNMKKSTKLNIKKVTLRNLEEPSLDAIAAGCCPTISFPETCLCPTKVGATCNGAKTCVDCS